MRIATTHGPIAQSIPQHHPERRAGEMLLGYFSPDAIDSLLWKTARPGGIVLDCLGQPMESRLIPIFVKTWELRRRLGAAAVGYLPEEGRGHG